MNTLINVTAEKDFIHYLSASMAAESIEHDLGDATSSAELGFGLAELASLSVIMVSATKIALLIKNAIQTQPAAKCPKGIVIKGVTAEVKINNVTPQTTTEQIESALNDATKEEPEVPDALSDTTE